MSHFSVLCIGDVDANMERFSEQDEKFFSHIDDEDGVSGIINDYENHKGDKEFLAKHPEGDFKSFMDWWNGTPVIGYNDEVPEDSAYVRMSEDGTTPIEYKHFWNPDAVYDYYQDGYNAFITKDGKETNHAFKKDIDFDAMKRKHDTETREEYRKVILACGNKIPYGMTEWKDLIKKVDAGELDIDKARDIYNEQEQVKTFDKNKESVFGSHWFGWGFSLEDYACTEDEYVAKNPDYLSYGLVKDNEYYSRGEMGWWGMSHGDISVEEWSKKFWELIDSLPDDEELTMLDCHI